MGRMEGKVTNTSTCIDLKAPVPTDTHHLIRINGATTFLTLSVWSVRIKLYELKGVQVLTHFMLLGYLRKHEDLTHWEATVEHNHPSPNCTKGHQFGVV